ncbi:MAG: hypothetical protein KDH97_05580 [Calditrichaeota bacterium]|nr:hypothetical protein [Calditrichota bacterium]MCB0296674.1 hypothetical protein [Calditrichota bacterium]MCB0304633.1 hypothetical protein [Calditrichota bacterium]
MRRELMIPALCLWCFVFATAIGAGEPFDGEAGLGAPADTVSSGPIAPFDRLLGTWEVTQSILNQDGSWSVKPQKYRWKFYPILEGEAVQDDWIVVDSTGQETVAGTNIRIFNPEENQWHMAWIDKTVRRTAVFTAKNEDGKVLMEGTNAKGRHIRNTFYNISENSFEWQQEWTFDEGQSWVAVARIRGTR